MLTNSLFKDFLVDNGLDIYKEESTRDIICLEFNFGTRSFKSEIDHLKKIAKNVKLEFKLAKSHGHPLQIQKIKRKRKKISSLYLAALENEDLYEQRSKEAIREYYYVNGVTVPYVFRKRDGTIKRVEEIRYKMLFRSTGKAKKGSCMFIRKELYDKAKDFLYMGIQLPEKNAPIVEVSAYAPLVASGIVGKIKIDPKNILVLKDVDRFMTRDIISVETNKNRECVAKDIKDYTLKNTLFDGQALIDSSIFPEWGNGYVLLRHHFCKMAAFCTHIQKFFRNYFGDDYPTAKVTDMFGNEHYAKDIELITTDNAMKYLKLDISYDYWCERVYENGCMFGIVKTAHPSKLGDVQKMSYQMVNSLDEDIMESVVKESVNYVEKLKTDNETYLEYLRKKSNFSNDYEALVSIVEFNPEFIRSSYFRERKYEIVKAYVRNLKNGELIQNADNLVIVGSPYAMLLYSASGNPNDVDKDDTFFEEEGVIQCYTERFNSGEFLAGFRSPFNGRYNMDYLHNIYSRNLARYFEIGSQCIAVNMIGTDFQDRNNGSDQDSDSIYTTNQPDIVEHAKYCYHEYPTIVNNIPKEKNVYSSSMRDYAKMDNMLSKSQTDIGESSNLAQVAQTYACSFGEKKYEECVCILSVLAQCAIDSAKRRFDVDITSEIKRLKAVMDVKEHKYPAFWLGIRRGFNRNNINYELHCPMNYLYNLEFTRYKSTEKTLPMSYFFQKFPVKVNRKTCRKVENLITQYSICLGEYNIAGARDNNEYLLLRSDFDDLINAIRSVNISGKYLGLYSWLIDRAFLITPQSLANADTSKSTISKNKSLLIKTLWDVNSSNLLKILSKNL